MDSLEIDLRCIPINASNESERYADHEQHRAGVSEPRLRGFPRSGVRPAVDGGLTAAIRSVEPRSRGFSPFGFSHGPAEAQAEPREAP